VSDLYIESLTKTHFYKFSKSNLEELYRQNIKFQALGRLIAEKAYLFTVTRMTDFQTKNLKTRYQELLKDYPDLF
jgi:uncharacterized C2H2 Zn-finger protein